MNAGAEAGESVRLFIDVNGESGLLQQCRREGAAKTRSNDGNPTVAGHVRSICSMPKIAVYTRFFASGILLCPGEPLVSIS
jgi:hypothetical protein